MRPVRAWMTIAVVVLSGTPAPADLPAKEYAVTMLASGVYGFVWKDPLQDPIEGNSLFVINEEDVLVVDASLFPSSTRIMIRELKKLTSKPVRYVVNTHFHDDHCNGNFLYREEWPGVEFIAHRNTRQDIIDKVINQRPEDIQGFKDNIARYSRWLADGTDDNGKTLDEARRKRVQDVLGLYEQGVREYGSVRDAPPDLTFTDSLVLHRGTRTIRIVWLGRGNTRGDAVTFLPRERIAAVGDLLVHPVPFAFGSYYKEWANTLARVDSLDADILFPGHGPPMPTREYLHDVHGLLKSLTQEVDSAVAAGATLDETQRTVTLTGWRNRFGMNDQARETTFDQFFLAPAVERAWHQAKGDEEGE